MKLLAYIFCFSLVCLACNKMVEDTKKNMALDIMTNGQWYVKSYTENNVEIAAQFEGYTFLFKEDGSVSAVKNAQSVNGTWEGDVINYSIISNFPGSVDPLKKLNGTWKLKDSGNDFVVAEMEVPDDLLRLRLEKKL